MAPLHNYERQATGEAPVLDVPCPIKLHSGVDQFGLKWHHLDARVRMDPPVTLGCNAASPRVGAAVQPFPKHGLSGHDVAPGPDHELVPCDRTVMMLVPLARQPDPKGGIGEVGGHYPRVSFLGRP